MTSSGSWFERQIAVSMKFVNEVCLCNNFSMSCFPHRCKMSNAQQKLGRLTELVNTLSNHVTCNQQQPTNVPVEDQLRRLYPRVDISSSTKQEARPVNTSNAFRQSDVTASSNIFKPSIQYRTHRS